VVESTEVVLGGWEMFEQPVAQLQLTENIKKVLIASGQVWTAHWKM